MILFKRICLQVLLFLCFVFILMAFYNVQMKDQELYSVGYEERISLGSTYLTSKFFYDLASNELIHINLEPQILKNPNPNLQADELFINGTRDSIAVNVPSRHKFSNKDVLGYVDYTLTPTNKFYVFFTCIYVVIAFFLWYVFNGGGGQQH